MSQKTFCDICDKQILLNFKRLELRVPCPKYEKGKIVISITVSLADHPNMWLGSPDLCEDCIRNIIKKEFKFK